MGTAQQSTVRNSTRHYRLRDSLISNLAVAAHLGISNGYNDYPCCFFRGGNLVAERTEQDEVVIYPVFEDVQAKMADLGDSIE